MGAVCSGGIKDGRKEKSLRKLKSSKSFGKEKQNSHSYTNGHDSDKTKTTTTTTTTTTTATLPQRNHSGELLLTFSRELKPSTPARPDGKVNQKSSFLGKAGTVGLEKAVEVLDTLGSSMSNLNARGGFVAAMGTRGNRISILAFEVANTIAKAANLFQSLSEENVQFLKKEILHSEGVQQLVSTDMNELLIIAAADKREEFDVFSREVIRFGDLCKDPQWHNLGRYFSKLDSEFSSDKRPRAEAEVTMKDLTTMAQHTSELYHEFNALDRFEQDYQRKYEELEALHLPQKGDNLVILQRELKEQRKIVRSLKKKSLWSKTLEEIMEKFVDIVTYLHHGILEAFGNNGQKLLTDNPSRTHQRLGAAGLALHYANVINQIDNVVSRPTSLPPNTRDTLYQGLPPSIKTALRSRLQMVDVKEELTIPQVKDEMEKTLHWLVPVAANTAKAHQGFGWVGEWANTGHELGKNIAANGNLIRLQTLYHADKQKTDQYILELVTWLHRLIHLVKARDQGLKTMPFRSVTRKGIDFQTRMQRLLSLNLGQTQISQEDRDLLNKVCARKLVPGRSKSQELSKAKKKGKVWALSRSTGSSPIRETDTRQRLDHRSPNILDVMDGLDLSY